MGCRRVLDAALRQYVGARGGVLPAPDGYFSHLVDPFLLGQRSATDLRLALADGSEGAARPPGVSLPRLCVAVLRRRT